MAVDKISIDRFIIMERKLLYGIMTPGGILTIAFGFWLMFQYNYSGIWLHLKILCVLLLSIYHLYCFKYFFAFKENKNKHSHIFFRWFNEVPVAFLIIIIFLVVFKPI
jgi:putative membrane protein